METVHLLITGKVQGVFFRDSSKKVAGQLRITGWIKNLDDGKVEAMISGEPKDVQAFVDWCKSGPDRADVKEVIVSKQQRAEFNTFEIKRGF